MASSTLPKFHLLCALPQFSTAFNTAVSDLYPDLHQKTKIEIHNCKLSDLKHTLHFDAVVSPANSYGRLDGAFDDALAETFAPGADQYEWITQKAQQTLYQKWKGYAPPGTCTIVPLTRDTGENPWGTRYLLLCPTMRIPQNVKWDREVVYECIWSLLCAVDEHNRNATNDKDKITDILTTPLATGVGRVSPRRWAEQCVFAMKYWVEAVENEQIWSNLDWKKIHDDHEPIAESYWRET